MPDAITRGMITGMSALQYHRIRHKHDNVPGRKRCAAPQQVLPPPGTYSVMASHAGGCSVLEEGFWREREKRREREQAHGHFFRLETATCHYTHLSGSNEMSRVNCNTTRNVILSPQAPYLSPQMRKTAFSRGP